MHPRVRIKIPATMVGSGLASGDSCNHAAEKAAGQLLESPLADWRGHATTLLNITSRIGNTEEIRYAAKQVFKALVEERASYHDYRDRVHTSPLAIRETTRDAVNYFHHVFERSHDFKSMGLGRGELLLSRMDFAIEQQIKKDQSAQGLLTMRGVA